MISEAGVRTIVIANMHSSSSIQDLSFRFVTNHAHVLQIVSEDPSARLRDIARIVGITERTVAHLLDDLEEAGYLTKTRDGRRNRYQLDGERRVRTPRLATMTIAQLLGLLLQALEQPLI